MTFIISDKLKITGFNCGRIAYKKFITMGIHIGSIIEIIALQPLEGPITVRIEDTEISIGRGMMSKLEYEMIEGK